MLSYLSITLCIAQQNLSLGVNVICEGSPSRILRVLRISLGITILPKSSTRRTIPVAFIVYLSPFLYSEMCQKPSIYAGFRDLLVYSNYTSPKPILPLFSFVPVGHKGLEDLGRVVVFVLC